MRCSKCGAKNPDGAKFCIECASPFARRCSSCGKQNPPRAKFCLECSKPIDPPPVDARETLKSSVRVSAVGDSAELEGERKTVTALFADIKGSTELEQDLDPEEARAIVDPALKLMIDAARRYDGYIVQSTGDGIFALFGAPVAHEDHAQRALYAALRMQEEIRRYADRQRAEGRAPIQIRVGANTGEVVLRSITTGAGQVEYTPIGHTTNLASRMQTLANPGSTVIAESTRKLVEGYFALKPLGLTRVKGVTEPVNVHEVTGLGPLRTRLQRSAGRGLSKFVGREREMAAMEAAAERATAGHGQIVAAMAQAGTGKSRLFYEFKVKNQSGWMVLETFSVSHGKASAFLPVLDLLHAYFKIIGEDDARARREKIGGKVLMLDRALEDTLPYLFALLGIVEGDDPLEQMDAQVRKRRTLDAIKRLLLRESLNQPLMVIFEDLHWIDEETQALLNLLTDSIANAKILLLVNYRPEYSHQWNSKTCYSQLRLDPLDKESADEMLSALLGDGAEMAQLKRVIIEKTEGNPFFMEETVQVLLDEGSLVRDGATARLTKPIGELKIPPTVQGILAARIDRLSAESKDLLQALAVIGREFSLSLIRAVVPKSDDELSRMLNDLQLGEFIYEQPAVGDIEYSFKHALTQEVAYGSLLSERRAELHERCGDAIEECFALSLDDHLTDLAHHYSFSSNKQKAIHYLKLAGLHASQQSANREAVTFLRRALGMLNTLERGPLRDAAELDLQLAIGPPLMATRGFGAPEVESAYARALELIRRSPDSGRRFQVLGGLWRISGVRGNLRHSRELAEDLIEIAGNLRDPARTAAAEIAMGVSLNWSGNFVEARSALEHAISLDGGREMDFHLGAVDAHLEAGGQLALCLWFLGYPDQSLKVADRVERLIEKKRDQLDRANALMLAMFLYQLRGDRHQTAAHATQAIAIASQIGLPHIRAVASAWLAWSDLVPGHAAKVLAEMRESATAYESVGASAGRSWGCAVTAEILLRFGNPAAGLRLVAAGLAHAESADERICEAELYRIWGELKLACKPQDLDDSEAEFLRAITLAKSQNARSLELRATTSLARLLDRQGKRDDARAMLAEIYNWFTEGFDTADLKDAKALLDELAG
jgi:class 3 adenylate cyclase/tetratricopeptide (TPR) repeat protein